MRDATGRAILDPNSLENQPTTNERSAIIASTVRQYQAGEDISVDLDEVRLRSIPKQAVEDAHRNLPKGERLSLSIGDLMYYSLGFSDSNASAILLQYLGNSLKSLELSANTAPLYESAKLMALYAEDTKINPEVRKFVNEIMYFNVTGKDAIQRGVRESIYFQEQERLGKDVPRFSSHKQINSVPTPPSLKIYSREGIGGIVEDEGRRTSISDLALIEYEGRSYVLVVAVKDIRGRLAQSERNGEQAIAATARTLFDYILSRPHAAPSAATTSAAQ